MDLDLKEIKQRVNDYFGERNKDEEDLTTYTKRAVKTLEQKVGFTKFHQHIQLVLKTIVGNFGLNTRDDWAEVCSKITGYETKWLLAIGIYLTPEQIAEWNEDTGI